MKNLKLLFTALLLLCCVGMAKAHDFKAGGIYYKILSSTDKTVRVTYGGYNYDSYDNEYTGSVVIPESVTYNGTTYSVTSIGYDAFRGCTGLTSIEIPNSVTSIGNVAFHNCTGLKSITIPNSVKIIGYYAFRGTAWYNNQPDGVVYAGKVLYKYKGTMPANTSITINNGTLSIAGGAFSGCDDLTSITIPNSITSIGEGAFAGCTGLTSIEIPNSVTSIGKEAFYNCTGLTSVVIGNSVTSIGYRAFYGCTGLTSITIPNSVTSIGENAFRDCFGLTSITIPNSVTSIGESAFSSCSGLTAVHISDLAAWCNIDFATSDANPLYNAKNLYINGDLVTNLVIPNRVTSIGKLAFYNCTSLTSITIPNSVTGIGESAFSGCTGLTAVHISDLAAWCNIDFANSDANPLYNAKNLYINGDLMTNLVIPNSVTSIGDATFANCINLKSITIHDGVKTIGESAFSGCSKVETIYIGNSIEGIKDYAFANCNNIFEIEIASKKAITASGNVFSNDAYNNVCLYVPKGRKFAYERTTPWKNFYIVEKDFTGNNKMNGKK